MLLSTHYTTPLYLFGWFHDRCMQDLSLLAKPKKSSNYKKHAYSFRKVWYCPISNLSLRLRGDYKATPVNTSQAHSVLHKLSSALQVIHTNATQSSS